jgi:hypothetical protein
MFANMKVSEIQNKILKETRLKTSVKVFKTGSMRGYIKITPMFQNGSYPLFPFDFVQKLKSELADFDYSNMPLFCSTSQVSVYQITDDRIKMKTERKPKITESKTWGSKNSQMRLDKASARNGKRIRNGGVAKF